MKNIKELMEWRFACKEFDAEKKISKEDLEYILECARLAPSSFGLQAWKFIVITNEELKAKLAPACYSQPQITQSSALVFLCARTDVAGDEGMISKYTDHYRRENNKTEEEAGKFRAMMDGTVAMRGEDGTKTWLQKQAYLPAQVAMLAAAEKGIDSCPMEGFDPVGVSGVLELPDFIHPTVLVTLGYRKGAQPKKIRFPADMVIEYRN